MRIEPVVGACLSAMLLLSAAGARADCIDPKAFRLEIRNLSPAQIDYLTIDALDGQGIGELRVSPKAAITLCLAKRPARCRTSYQVAYTDYPPHSYEQDICRNSLIRIRKE